jgi:hypothetical protein
MTNQPGTIHFMGSCLIYIKGFGCVDDYAPCKKSTTPIEPGEDAERAGDMQQFIIGESWKS